MMRRRFHVCLLSLLAALSIPSTPLAAQPDTAALPSAELLKRIAEAVDGYRAGGTAYVVVTQARPFVVLGVYGTRPRADSVAFAAPRTSRVVGPYQSTQDEVHVRAFIIDTCGHRTPTRIDCPNAMYERSAEFAPLSDIDSVIVTIRRRTGTGPSRRIAYGNDIDALFFTPAAIDKFVIPYYVRIIGVDSAAAMRRRMLLRLP